MLKSVKTQVVWDVLKKEERVLYILPPLYQIEHPYLQQYYTQTLQAILLEKPKYILLYIENFDFTEESLRAYESFFQVEIQWLLDFSHLTQPEFMDYHTPHKTYLYNRSYPLPYPSYLFDITINDNLSITCEGARSGKLILEEFVNHSFYLNKVISRIEQSLGMHQSYTDSYDIAFVLGEDIPQLQQLQNLLTEFIKRNQCSAIFSINSEVFNHLRTFKRTRFPLVLTKQLKGPHLVDTLKKVALSYSTIIFLGKLTVVTKEWLEFVEKLQKHSLYDPLAFSTLLPPNKQNLFRVTTQPYQLLKRFLEAEPLS